MSQPIVSEGDGAVVIAVPHAGTQLPDAVCAALNETGRALSDTDWHVDRLYDGLLPGATTVRATVHRYAIDANRDPAGQSLYPGQNTTDLIPQTDFHGAPIRTLPPDTAEATAMLAQYHRPYHAALAAQVHRVRARHGFAILYDAHSIRSRLPFLFEGVLPDFSIGTNDGVSCAPAIEAAVAAICRHAEGYTTVVNGRFKGGWTTRHYGRPEEGVHAIQMELVQRAYLTAEAPPFAYDTAKADRLRGVLGQILKTLDQWRPA